MKSFNLIIKCHQMMNLRGHVSNKSQEEDQVEVEGVRQLRALPRRVLADTLKCRYHTAYMMGLTAELRTPGYRTDGLTCPQFLGPCWLHSIL